MDFWGWLLLGIATVISAVIIERGNLPNWYILIVLPLVWLAGILILVVLQLVILMLPFILIVGAILYLIGRAQRSSGVYPR